jgi:hypothetical protein
MSKLATETQTTAFSDLTSDASKLQPCAIKAFIFILAQTKFWLIFFMWGVLESSPSCRCAAHVCGQVLPNVRRRMVVTRGNLVNVNMDRLHVIVKA